jgi:NitT/TauT family transport system ATP-binding protein
MSLIEYKGLTKKFPDGNKPPRTVLNNIDLSIEAGEFVTLIGGSGSGKTTLFNHLLGTLFPTAGTVTADGRPITGVGPDRGIVPQKYSLYPNLTVLDNIAFGPLLSQTTNSQRLFLTPHWRQVKDDAKAQAMAMLPTLELDPRDANRFPHELSGGMRQRVAIGAAIIMRPGILMMDEPFGALDPETRLRMQRLILSLWKNQKLTIIFVTHGMEEALYLGTRVVGLSKWWTNADGSPGDGARIVLDRYIPEPHMRPESFMDTQEFHDACINIRRLVLNGQQPLSAAGFDLFAPERTAARS